MTWLTSPDALAARLPGTRIFLFLLGAIASVAPLDPSWAATILVPGDQPTIQAGIDAAAAGDSVLVAPGDYSGPGNEDIDFGGKDLVLRSELGPDVTTIQGPGIDGMGYPDPRAFQFLSGETPAAVLDGFTMRDFYVLEPEVGTRGGGAIFVDHGAAPTIRNCIFLTNSFTDGEGGAVYAEGGLFEDCQFLDNSADAWNSSGRGGAISLRNGTLVRCVLRGNWAAESDFGVGLGGGVFAGTGVLIEDCLIVENSANFGGGVYLVVSGNGPPEENWIAGTTLASNEALGGGAQLYFSAMEPSTPGQRLYLTTSVVWSTGFCGPNDVQTYEDIPGTARLTFICSIVDRSAVSGTMETFYDPHTVGDDPLLCDPRDCESSGTGDYALQPESPCLPGNSSCGVLLGAIGEVCGASTLPETVPSHPLFVLDAPRPNPARTGTQVPFSLGTATHVRATVFDASGRRVAGVFDGPMTAGSHEISWNLADDAGRRVPTGVYNLRVVVAGAAESVRLTVLE